MEKKIEEMTMVELEACAYRQIVALEQVKLNLRLITEEIQKRSIPKVEKEGVG